MTKKLTYEFTNNYKYLRSYYRIRKIIYKIELGIVLQNEHEYYDSISDILIVRSRHKCIGGARLTYCKINSDTKLPAESNTFRFKFLLPHLSLEKHNYAEFSRLVLLPEYRNSKVTHKIYKQLNKRAKQLGVRYIFVITDKAHARLYLRSYRKLGYTAQIIKDIKLPNSIKEKYDNVVECIMMLDLIIPQSQS